MIRRLYKKAKGILFADPEALYEKDQERLGQPFHFPGTNGKAVLLIHGWTSVPYEVQRLGIFLNEKGYTVTGPLLTGHGTQAKDLLDVQWEEWRRDVTKSYHELKKNHEQVYVVGTSMGANLTAMLAADNPEISGVVLMAMPYNFKRERLFFLVTIISWFKKYSKKYYPASFGRPGMITRKVSYQTYPLKSVLEVFKLVKNSRLILSKINQPCLIMQSASDHIVTRNSLEKIFSGVSSKIKRKKYIQKAYHTFISDIEKEHVFEDIFNFFEEN